MKTNFELVKEFHECFKVHPLASPTYNQQQLVDFLSRRYVMLLEEMMETARACENLDAREVIDGLLDIIYVAYGTLDLLGVNADEAFAEVHLSNMSKLDEDGQPIFDENLKIKKGPNFKKPDLTKFVEQAKQGMLVDA